MIEIRPKATMPFACIIAVTLAAALSPAQQPSLVQQPGQPEQLVQPMSHAETVQSPPKGCIAVQPTGSHAFRNIMLLGVAGAFISKQQYKVVDVAGYPARMGQKYHGDELQTIQGGGTKVVLLNKRYTQDDLRKACPATQ
jgi:hypothetical protein